MKFWRILIPAAVIGIVLFALTLFWIYGTETHHASRNSIWWSERGRNLIPPAATDITLQQDLLDHYATYTISEKDLNAFLNERASLAMERCLTPLVREAARPPLKLGRQSAGLDGS